MSHNAVKHIGVIAGIRAGRIVVAVNDLDGCSGCSIRMFCGQEKDNISIAVGNTDDYAVGDRVEVKTVGVSRSMAMWICVLLPCILLLSVTIGCLVAELTETVAVVAGLLACVAYYGTLYVFRSHRGHDLKWIVKKI